MLYSQFKPTKKKSEFLPLLVKIIKVKAGSKMGIFSRQSTGVYNTMSQSKKNVFGVNERFIHKEFFIECFWKNIWTILEERSQNKIDQNQKGKRRTSELIKYLLYPGDTWRACTGCYDQAPQKIMDHLDGFFIHKSLK